MGLRAVRGADKVDVLETLLAGAYSKFRTWPRDNFQPWGVICGLVLSTLRLEASLSEIDALAKTYRQCEARYGNSGYTGSTVHGTCPLGLYGYGKMLLGIRVAKTLVHLNLL